MSWGSSFQEQVLERMSFLHCEMMGRNESNRFKEQNDHSITFVYDSDVLFCFTAPWEWGPSRGTSHGYGQLLPRTPAKEISDSILKIRQSEDSDAWHIAKLLADKALAAGNADRAVDSYRIKMFCDHRDEVNEAEQYLQKQLDTVKKPHQNYSEKQRFARMTNVLLNRMMTTNTSKSEILDFATSRMENSLLETFDGRSSGERTLENYRQLESKIGQIETFSAKTLLDAKDGPIAAVKASFRQTEMFAASILQDFWTDQVKKRRYNSFDSDASKSDIQALVDISLLNRRTLEVNHPERYVFVTGSMQLVKATYTLNRNSIRRYVESFINRKLPSYEYGFKTTKEIESAARSLRSYFGFGEFESGKILKMQNWFANYSFHYVRHFWAVAGEALVEAGETKRLDDLFHGLFAMRGVRLKLSRRNVEDLVMRGPKTTLAIELPEFDPKSIQEKWKEFTRSRIRDARVLEFGLSEIDMKKLKGFNSMEPTALQNIWKELTQISDRKRDRTMLSLSNLGALDLLRTNPSRSTFPDVYFATLFKTQSLLRKLSTGAYNDKSRGDFLKDFEEIREDCFGFDLEGEFDDRQLSHLKFLILACIFASQDRWGAAYGHALRAQNIIEGSKEKIPVKEGSKSNMSGRESQLLIAICLRMRANSKLEFRQAAELLLAAKKSLRRDIAYNPDTDKAFHEVRIENESLAFQLCKYYYWRSRQSNGERLDISEHVDSVYAFAKMNIQKFNKLFAQVFLKKSTNSNQSKLVLTVDTVSRSILEVFVISKYRKEVVFDRPTNADFLILVESALKWLNYRNKNREYYVEPGLTKFYRLSTGTAFSEHEFPKFENSQQLEEVFRQALPENSELRNDVSVYDDWRIRALRRFVLSQLSS